MVHNGMIEVSMKTALFRMPVPAIFCLALLAFLGCSKNAAPKSSPQKEPAVRDINAVVQANIDTLIKIKGVVGVYTGAREDGKPCIMVNLDKRDTIAMQKVPKTLEGFPVELVIPTGTPEKPPEQ